jgi:ferrochelatase
MSFRPEPAHRHGQPARTAVLLVNLGTPDEPTAPALRRYLAEFLSDPRVVEIPRLLWLPILHGIILRVRPAKSAAKYASRSGRPKARRWRCGRGARRQALQGRWAHAATSCWCATPCATASRRMARCWTTARRGRHARAGAAAVSAIRRRHHRQRGRCVHRWALGARWVPELRFVGATTTTTPATSTRWPPACAAHWARSRRGRPLVLSFHGVPERSLHLGDPYHCQCHVTARLLREKLGLPAERVVVTFQSRFGKAKWLEPYTEPTLRALAAQGVKRVDVMCPGFAADCLETLEEIGQEVREAFVAAGGQDFRYVPCLNDEPDWIAALATLTERHLQGWDTKRVPLADEAARQRALAMGARD